VAVVAVSVRVGFDPRRSCLLSPTVGCFGFRPVLVFGSGVWELLWCLVEVVVKRLVWFGDAFWSRWRR
jgi:hypothetical protein